MIGTFRRYKQTQSNFVFKRPGSARTKNQLHPFMFFSRNKKTTKHDSSESSTHCIPNIFHHAVEVASHAVEKHDARLRETTLHHRMRESMSLEMERTAQARFGAVAGV